MTIGKSRKDPNQSLGIRLRGRFATQTGPPTKIARLHRLFAITEKPDLLVSGRHSSGIPALRHGRQDRG
jgi:hypothetical protein